MVSIKPWKLTISNEYLEFLGVFEAKCKMALAMNQGPRVD
jgi:hypothetical protein